MSIFENEMKTKRKSSQEEEEDKDKLDEMLGHCVKHQGVHSKSWQSKRNNENALLYISTIPAAYNVRASYLTIINTFN